MPQSDSIIKLHAVIFKHAQKKIIEKEINYQAKRIQCIKNKDMVKYKSIIRRTHTEYQQIEEYVRGKALGLMKLDLTLYNYAFGKALQQPSMFMKIRTSDESFRRRMWKRMDQNKEAMRDFSEDKTKKMYLELMEMQHQCELQCLKFDSWESGREELKICLLTE